MPFDFFIYFFAAISILGLQLSHRFEMNKFSAEEISSQYSSATARATAVAEPITCLPVIQ